MSEFQMLAQHRWLLSPAERTKVETAMTSSEPTTSTTSTSSSSTKPSKSSTPAKGARPKTLGQVQSEVKKRPPPQVKNDAKKMKVQPAPKSMEEQVDDLFLG
eukprot:5466164-Amphidinium_carterae.1